MVLEPVFNAPGRRGRKHADDLRTVVDAMLYICAAGDVWHNEPPSDPAEALKRQAGGHGRDIPVLTPDGATRLGTFHVTGASKDGPTAPVPLR